MVYVVESQGKVEEEGSEIVEGLAPVRAKWAECGGEVEVQRRVRGEGWLGSPCQTLRWDILSISSDDEDKIGM